ncbi:MAG: PolC-type DNA polymerase III [Lachnospiraceae bacterium]|nr:PolC-type DNA polymerase III [Lachnospiraceae bacterium]
MEYRSFSEVFASLKLNKDLQDAFSGVEVRKIMTTPDKRFVKVCIFSNHIIEYRHIHKMQTIIEQQCFRETDSSVRILQKYSLSDTYNLRVLMDVYGKSVIEEMKEYDHMLAVMMRQAEVSFEDDRSMLITVPDTRTNRSNESRLIGYLERIFTDRCGVDAIINVAYEEREYEYKNADDAALKRRIAEIAARAGIDSAYINADISTDSSMSDTGNSDVNTDTGAGVISTAESASNAGSVTDSVAAVAGGDSSAALATPADSSSSAGSFNRKKAGNRISDRQQANRRALKQSDNPDVIYGREFDGEAMPIVEIIGEIGEVVIRGKVLGTEVREIRGDRIIYFFDVTDFTDTMRLKVFAHKEQEGELAGRLKKGTFIKLKGQAVTDSYSKEHEIVIDRIQGIMEIKDFREIRSDISVRKRVELHCHSKMSDMDGVSDVKDLIMRAYKWGHPAIAITDHGVVQGFTEANHTVSDDIKDPNFKVIYGLEAYLVDDLSVIVEEHGPSADKRKAEMAEGAVLPKRSLDNTYVVFDLETTGFSAVKNNIIEIGAVKVRNGEVLDRFSEFVNPGEPIPYRITELTSITDQMVAEAESIETVLVRFLDFCKDSVLVAHNAGFDTSFIREKSMRLGLQYDFIHIDTVELARVFLPHLANYKLHTVAKDLKVSLEHHHRAVDDAECTAWIFIKLMEMVAVKGITTLEDLNEMEGDRAEKVRKLKSHHAIMLAKNNTGRVNLYHLVSESHINYFNRSRLHPCIPKSLFNKYREGILLGSACEAGELYRAIIEERGDEEIASLVNYYDYLEIQPVGNNMFMVGSEKYPDINSVEDIQEINRKIVELGEKFMKPVVATCDVHFLDPEDEVYRRIIMASKGFKDADNQAPLFLRTTEEMLQEFMYLGVDKANEVVIDNTVKIADMIDSIKPVRPDKCPPVIEDSDKTLTEICYNRAHEMYGDTLPTIVEERLKRELNSIISNGFAVMYIIAQKLVWKSVEDGYLVGSRGSVGSSFVATMSGITEVNPLSPHYYCPKCHYSDFDSEEVKAFSGMAGVDMPDKDCPECGTKMVKDGFDIPFETFLGFKGDKEPDIDLNFSGEYQSKAHKYTEVIFGAGQTFRAGTIASVADKTALQYVSKYFEERNIYKRFSEKQRLSEGCVGVRRSTGQHPGGIVVLPVGEDICSFTPIQRPANDMTTDTITTHFDYHSIDHNLLKLDILGHDDPTMIKMLQDLTGVDPTTIPLDDKGVMSLFASTEALKIKPEDIDNVPLGCLGIPEFGTMFAMNMLIATKPRYFSDLVRIAGLAHGTNVWQNNAEVLVAEGKATISTAICTRDDIMVYLIHMGVDSSNAFNIMENVRKGKVAKGKCKQWPEWKEEMMAHDVPDWYIWSCERIEYMFPKAHAAAYVMMAWRVAYCKIYYPLEFYTAFFTIRATAFDYELMCLGHEALLTNLKNLQEEIRIKKENKEKTTAKDDDTIRDMHIVLEMYARGYEFEPIDLRVVKAKHFQIVNGKIMASLTSISGLGENAAEAIVDGCKGEDFLSKEDFRNRTKASATITDALVRLGILDNLPETNQLSIFDFMSS